MCEVTPTRAAARNAKDEDDAEAKVNQKIADGLAKGIEVTYPKEWDISSDETDYQQRRKAK